MDPEAQRYLLVELSSPEEHVIARDARQRLDLALDALEPEKRAVLVMFELEGLPCSEIAELLGVPKGTVFSRLSSARQAFLESLQRLEKRDPGWRFALGGRP